MLTLWRNCGRGIRIPVQSLYSQAGVSEPVCQVPPVPYVNTDTLWTLNPLTKPVEGFQGEFRSMSVSDARRLLYIATEHRSKDVSVQGIQENYSSLASMTVGQDSSTDLTGQDLHSPVLDGINSHVSLHGCMQSTVPQPYSAMDDTANSYGGYSSCHNMPGFSNRLQDKYTMGALHQCHPSRQFSTSAVNTNSIQGTQQHGYRMEETLEDPSPQGIQGDDCVQFKLWMENCQRYSLPNCDEQMQALRTGRKTLAEVFLEQQKIIETVAEEWRRRHQTASTSSQMNSQGVQDSLYNFEFNELNDPCPQGLQGDDCANYRAWSHNCKALGFGDCADQVMAVRKGQKTLQDIFDEQDGLIRKIVADFQQKRKYSTSSNSSEVRNTGPSPSNGTPSSDGNSPSNDGNSPSNDGNSPSNDGNIKLSQKDRLKRAVKEYGGTVVMFHVGISLMSLGGFYLAVTSGLDVVGLLTKIGVGESILQSRIATGSTTFVIAYAVHKVFAPVRIAITLTCTPLLVRHLRKIGFLKPPKPATVTPPKSKN